MMAGIAVGWSDVANGLLIFNPITKELYTISLYKIDEHNATKNYFNITYYGGMFSGLYSIDSKQQIPEYFPIGTSVKIPSNTSTSKGYILAVPNFATDCTDDPLYTIQLINGGTTTVPESAMPHILNTSTNTVTISLPS